MKKIILSVAVLLACYSAKAQIVTDAGTFTKPVKGTTIFEVNASPNLSGGAFFALSDVNSNLGMVGIKLRRFDSEKRACRLGANLAVLDSGEPGSDTDFAIGLSAGLEYHRAGAERLSTYWGYEGRVGYLSINDGYGDQTKAFSLGANLFTGFDYYIMPKIYLGTEISYGVSVTNVDPAHSDSNTRVELAPSITPSLRLGWQF